ncbi:hypothetical protein CC80DRAFT_490105 [Byssothecium circinans]|uniref:CENP-V/GFA domain-containing protein n=1 Tax=Byssothecium circinans TaxID=147558 RepID=A0A6A5U470_9PLEO|nr:hypothetical protein CC80DRAFT_490105 [Byssothecium circinans]
MSTTASPSPPTVAAAAAPPSTTYTGSCHCKRTTYTVTQSPSLTDPACEVTNCNCSICSRNGYLLIYIPDKHLSFTAGGLDDFTKYTFAPKHKIAHHFCPLCGTSCFAKSTDPEFFSDYTAVNVRTLEGVELDALKLKEVDGKSI